MKILNDGVIEVGKTGKVYVSPVALPHKLVDRFLYGNTQFAHHYAKGSWVVSIRPSQALFGRLVVDLGNKGGFSYYTVGPIVAGPGGLPGPDGQFVGAVKNVFGSR